MKFKSIIKLVLVFGFVFIASQQVNGQYAYGVSDIVYDNATRKVTTFSGTALDYVAGLYYDPAVVGGVFQEGQLLGYASDTGFANIFSAIVRLRTINPSPPDTQYDVLSDHYIVAYFYVEVIIFDDDGTILRREWVDPLGLSRYGGAGDLSWTSFQGSSKISAYSEFQYFYLGTTGKGIIANPTVCQGALAPCPTPTPTPSPQRLR